MQQINQAQQQPQIQQKQPQQPTSYDGEMKKLKEDQAKLQRQREQAKKEQLRRQQERARQDARKQELRKQKIADDQRRSTEQRKRIDEYNKMIDMKKRQLDAAEKRVQQEQRRMYEKMLQDEKRQREQKKTVEKKQRLEQQQKKKKYLEFAKAEWLRNQQIRRNAEKRAMMDDPNYQSEPEFAQQPSNPSIQQQKSNILEEKDKQPRKPPQKSNYHYKEQLLSKPVAETAHNKPQSQRPPTQNRNKQPEPVLDDEQLMNAFVNPNFQKKRDQQHSQQKPIESIKFERPSSVNSKQQQLQQSGTSIKQDKQNDLKKKIEQGRQKMRMDRQKRQTGSMNDIDRNLTSEDTQPSIDETIKYAKWDRPLIQEEGSKKVNSSETNLVQKPQEKPIEHTFKAAKWQSPLHKANSEQLSKIIHDNEILEKMIQQEVLQQEKQSAQMQNMIDELKKIVNDVQEKVEMLPEVKVTLSAARKDDDIEPQRATEFHSSQNYSNEEVNLEYFSDYNKLESLRMSLEDVFGTDSFIRAYRIIEKDFDTLGMAGMDMDKIQKKIDFISEQLFTQHFTLLLTLIVMENKVNEDSR